MQENGEGMGSDSFINVEEFSNRARLFIDSGEYKTAISGVNHSSPWSNESLNACESLFIQAHNQSSVCLNEDYMMFLGEGLRRTFGGQWARGDSMSPDLGRLIGIRYPHAGHFDVVSNLVQGALSLRSGSAWSAFFATTKYLLSRSSGEEN